MTGWADSIIDPDPRGLLGSTTSVGEDCPGGVCALPSVSPAKPAAAAPAYMVNPEVGLPFKNDARGAFAPGTFSKFDAALASLRDEPAPAPVYRPPAAAAAPVYTAPAASSPASSSGPSLYDVLFGGGGSPVAFDFGSAFSQVAAAATNALKIQSDADIERAKIKSQAATDALAIRAGGARSSGPGFNVGATVSSLLPWAALALVAKPILKMLTGRR